MLITTPNKLILKMSNSYVHAMLCAFVLSLAVACLAAPARASVFSEGSVVLVLKLVSATRVQPTTGVVVSADGMVIVPADFISAGDEIVVMDGGTDISTYARPGILVKRDEASNLALISVSGLNRTPILQTRLVSPSNGDLNLAAFPPAEQIAEGDAPLWLPVDVSPAVGSNQWTVTNQDSLPNVSGPILDNCGFLAGLQLSNGAQSLTAGSSTSIIGAPLLEALVNLEIKLVPATCDTSATSERASEASLEENATARANSQPAAVLEKMPRTIDGKNAAVNLTVSDDEAAGNGSLNSNTDAGPASTIVAERPAPSVWTLVPWWLWLLIAVLMAALIFKLGTLWRLVNRSAAPSRASLPRHAPVVEPATIELLPGATARVTHGLADHVASLDQMPDITQLPEGFNAIICVTGQLSDSSKFSRYCIADKAHIDIIIGRGDADISIETASVSRQHARLKGTLNALTFSDLDSGNGTFIGAVPCLPGEIMFVGPTDEITLGDVRFTIAVKYKVGRLS